MTQVPVPADDILAVTAGWQMLTEQGTESTGLQRIQVLLAANAALGRMHVAIARGAGELPEDPVDGQSEAVVLDAALLDRYQSHGFSREEAFALVHATVQARVHAIGLAMAAQASQGNSGG